MISFIFKSLIRQIPLTLKTCDTIRSLFSFLGPKKDHASTLKRSVRKIVSLHGIDPDALLLQDKGAGKPGFCHTFLVGISPSIEKDPRVLLRSYMLDDGQFVVENCKIWEAARATTAASDFFSPITLGSPHITFEVSAIFIA